MMKTLFALLSSLFLINSAIATCEQDDFSNSSKKHYITSDDVEITDSTILVHFLQQPMEVDALLVDQGGVYFTDEMLRCLYCRRQLNPKNTCEHACCLTQN